MSEAYLRVAAEWAVWAVWISKANRLPSTIGKARQKSGLFSQSRADPRRDQARCRLLVLEANRYTFRLKRQLHTTVVHHQLVRHLTLLAPAQDFIQILPGVEQTVEILVASRELGKATV